MTITVSWTRRNRATAELLIASDSRLRSRGAMDQAQKLYRLDRGDCCLAFCGDAQVAYPLFIQVGTALNNFVKMRSRAEDVTKVKAFVGDILDNMVGSWDLNTEDLQHELVNTRILVAGWSWHHSRYDCGFFKFENGTFRLHHQRARLPHPWKEKGGSSLIFIGDYEVEYMAELNRILAERFREPERRENKSLIEFGYEPIEALHGLLKRSSLTEDLSAIGGAAQLVKIYPYGNSLPIVIRANPKEHYLLGRRLFDWEKTEYPVLDLSEQPPSVLYPMSEIPLPSALGLASGGQTGEEREMYPPGPSDDR